MNAVARAVAVVLAAGAVAAPAARAQEAVVAPGVDTASRTGRELLALWRSYLRDRRVEHWSVAERARWPMVDLVAPWVYPDSGAPPAATVVEIAPDVPGDTATWVIRTLFATPDRPVALARVYAVRDSAGRWSLANALPRLTREWARQRVGRVEFVYPPARRFDSTLAARSARFVDSAARAVGVAPPAAVIYYLVGAPREVARVLGLDWAPNSGGRLYAEDALLLAGVPSATEWNPHDLAHVVLAPLAARAPRSVNEGAATWLGGWHGRDFRTLVREMDADLARSHPAWTLDTILAPHAWRDTISYPALGVLAGLAFERRGRAGLERLLASTDGTPDGIRRAAAAAIGVTPDELAALWRRRVRAWAAP